MQHLREPEKEKVYWEYVEPVNSKKKAEDKVEDVETATKKPTISLPSSVFASTFEENEGLLRKAAPRTGPRPDWDPDIVAALDDDFDFDNPENELDDNFMEIAKADNLIDGDSEYGSDIDSDDLADDEDDDDEERDGLGPLRMYQNEESKSRFTEYSMSSSVIRRNEQLQMLDEHFEKFYERYDDAEIGPLDCEEIEGTVDMTDDLLNQCLVEFKRDEQFDLYNKEWDRERIKKIQDADSSDEELVEMDVGEEKARNWDCESILSTYSNIYNHPKLIEIEGKRRVSKISINPKTGVPENVFHGENNTLTTKALSKFNNENRLA